MSDPAPRPYFLVCPYLPLKEALTFGGWWLGPLAQFDDAWLSSEFEEEARRFVAGFRDVAGQDITNPALLVGSASGADGRPPTDADRQALELTIGFATVDSNQ